LEETWRESEREDQRIKRRERGRKKVCTQKRDIHNFMYSLLEAEGDII